MSYTVEGREITGRSSNGWDGVSIDDRSEDSDIHLKQ